MNYWLHPGHKTTPEAAEFYWEKAGTTLAVAVAELGIKAGMRTLSISFARIGMELTAVLTPAEEGGYIALNPETGTTTQGETVEEAVANLKEATALYLSEFPLPAPGHPVVTMFSLPANA